MKSFWIFFILIPVSEIFSQCCSPGSPLGGTEVMGTLNASAMQFFLNYKHGYSGDYFEGDHRVPSEFISKGRYHSLNLNMAYGVSDRFMLEMETGYMIDKSQFFVEGIFPSRLSGHGITDLRIGFRGNIFRNADKEIELTSGMGAKFPLGSSEKEYQGAVLPIDLQPSSGSLDYFYSLFLYKGVLKWHLRFFVNSRIEINRPNTAGYRYGNLYASSFFASYNKFSRWILIMQIRSEIRGMDERIEGSIISGNDQKEKMLSSGSQKILAIPQVSYLWGKGWNISVLADLPVYRYYNHRQLASSFAVTFSVSKLLNLGSERKPTYNTL